IHPACSADSRPVANVPSGRPAFLPALPTPTSPEMPDAPRFPRNDPQTRSSASATCPPRSRRRLVLVEAGAAVVRTLARLLAGFDVAIGSARAVADAREPAVLADAVLCDVYLTDEPGTELVRSLRRDRFARPIIMISGDRTRSTVL